MTVACLRRPSATPSLIVAFSLALACGESTPAARTESATDPLGVSEGEASAGEVVVFAATSLRLAFEDIARSFEASHPGVEVTLQLAGTQELRAQIEHGAPADVLAAADLRSMEALEAAGLVEQSVLFARNEPVLVVSSEARVRIRSFADLPTARTIVLGGSDVPIGRYSAQILDRASSTLGAGFRDRVEARVVSRELNVAHVLAKVLLGEAEAGLVYRTDVVAARGELAVVEIPPDLNVTADYPIAVVRHTPHAALATEFLAAVLAAEGQRHLADRGFRPAAVGVP